MLLADRKKNCTENLHVLHVFLQREKDISNLYPKAKEVEYLFCTFRSTKKKGKVLFPPPCRQYSLLNAVFLIHLFRRRCCCRIRDIPPAHKDGIQIPYKKLPKPDVFIRFSAAYPPLFTERDSSADHARQPATTRAAAQAAP